MIESACPGIGSARVLVGGVDQLILGHAFKDLRGITERVPVFDGPVVVGADGHHGVVALDGTVIHVDVGRHVVHDRTGMGLP